MKRRDFSKYSLLAGLGTLAGCGSTTGNEDPVPDSRRYYLEEARKLPARQFDVVVAGGGTAGVVAALAAARTGAKTMLIESKGYTGGTVTEGGTALHSYYNLWKAFPGVEKRQVVKGIAQEIIDRLLVIGGTSGHGEMSAGFDYDSVCTCIDTELYKLVTMRMLAEAGVFTAVNTLLVSAITEDATVMGVITESRSGREAVYARSFIDCTAYGDLAAHAGADFTEPNDYPVCNSVGLGNVDIDRLYRYVSSHDAINQLSHGIRSGIEDQIVRIQGNYVKISEEFNEAARAIGMSFTTTTVHDNYLMFIKFNTKMPVSPTDRDAVSETELLLREYQFRGVELFRKWIPGCEKAFIARTSPALNIRRGRLITCDYDISHEDVVGARHFDDEVFVYGFHDMAPRWQVRDGGTYGIPYRAMLVKGLDNLFACGMMITSDHRAHMSTRNTVCCMGQGQATGTAAALCAAGEYTSRTLPFGQLRKTLEIDGVNFKT